MERGFEQLFVIALIIFATLVDMFVRWLKRRASKDQPPDAADVTDADVAGADVVYDRDDERVWVEEADTELPEQEQVELQLPPPPPPPPPPAPARLPFPRPSPPARLRPRRRRRAHRWLKHPIDARRGIVLMAILGPCRGLQSPHSDA